MQFNAYDGGAGSLDMILVHFHVERVTYHKQLTYLYFHTQTNRNSRTFFLTMWPLCVDCSLVICLYVSPVLVEHTYLTQWVGPTACTRGQAMNPPLTAVRGGFGEL